MSAIWGQARFSPVGTSEVSCSWGLFLCNSKCILLRINFGTRGPRKQTCDFVTWESKWMMSRFHYCLLKCEDGRRLLKWAQSLTQTWCTYTKKKGRISKLLKISMCSSAFHRRSTFPLPHKSSHPHGNFPNTRSSCLFFIVLSVMTNDSRIQITSWVWQMQWKEEPWGVRTNSFPLSKFSWGFLLGLPSLSSSWGKPRESVGRSMFGVPGGDLKDSCSTWAGKTTSWVPLCVLTHACNFPSMHPSNARASYLLHSPPLTDLQSLASFHVLTFLRLINSAGL